jgi:hypothetical protein
MTHLHNLNWTHRHLVSAAASALSIAATRRRAERAGLAALPDPRMSMDADEARLVGIRFVFDEFVAKHRSGWVGGVPTRADLEVLEKRTAEALAHSLDDVKNALRGHPRPQTCG